MKKALLLTVFFASFITLAFSQTDRYWSENKQSISNITTDKAVSRLSIPKKFKLFTLNIGFLRV